MKPTSLKSAFAQFGARHAHVGGVPAGGAQEAVHTDLGDIDAANGRESCSR